MIQDTRLSGSATPFVDAASLHSGCLTFKKTIDAVRKLTASCMG